MKKTKIIIPALAMLLLGTAASVSGTVAWFSVNNSVKVSGMTVHTSVSSNLLIAEDALSSAAKVSEASFGTEVNTSLDDTLLEPVSTVNGKNFFFTTDAVASGDGSDSAVYHTYNAAEVPTSSEDTAFDDAYGTSGAKGYKDYVFQLKATNTANASKDIKLTKLNLVYGGAQDASKAYRVAVFAQDITSVNPTTNVSGSLKNIFRESDSANFDATPKAVSAADGTLGNVTYNTASTTIGSVDTLATAYFKVVVRLYLEGEDTTCNNQTFASLTSTWALSLELKMDTASESNTAVSALSKFTSANVSETMWYYDGTYVWNDFANIGTATGRTAIASAAAAVQTAFGYSA